MMIEKKTSTKKKTRSQRKRSPKKIALKEITQEQREMAQIYSDSYNALFDKLAPWRQKALQDKTDDKIGKEFAHRVAKHAEKKIYDLLHSK